MSLFVHSNIGNRFHSMPHLADPIHRTFSCWIFREALSRSETLLPSTSSSQNGLMHFHARQRHPRLYSTEQVGQKQRCVLERCFHFIALKEVLTYEHGAAGTYHVFVRFYSIEVNYEIWLFPISIQFTNEHYRVMNVSSINHLIFARWTKPEYYVRICAVHS